MNDLTRKQIDDAITNNKVMVFMKGDRNFPQCGFSGAVVQMLDSVGADYETTDVLVDAELRQGIKEYSNWPTIPQVYIQGQFVGGSDILRELYYRGELQTMVQSAP